jgi:hypothetical protein
MAMYKGGDRFMNTTLGFIFSIASGICLAGGIMILAKERI